MKCKTYRYVKIQDLAGQIFNVQDLGVVNDTCKTLQESKTVGLFANFESSKITVQLTWVASKEVETQRCMSVQGSVSK